MLSRLETKCLAAPDAPPAVGGYAQAVQVTGATRLLFISGQVGLTHDEKLPASFRDQCRQAWSNIEAQLRATDMTLDNLVKVTTFLASRHHATENREVRQAVLGDRSPALTVVIAGLFDDAWLVEIEAIAAA
jgi:enamine deaminase RidA (YjgF/YER057c/UK114 family)